MIAGAEAAAFIQVEVRGEFGHRTPLDSLGEIAGESWEEALVLDGLAPGLSVVGAPRGVVHEQKVWEEALWDELFELGEVLKAVRSRRVSGHLLSLHARVRGIRRAHGRGLARGWGGLSSAVVAELVPADRIRAVLIMLFVTPAVDRADRRAGVGGVVLRELEDGPGPLDAGTDEGRIVPLNVVVVFAELLELATRVLREDGQSWVALDKAELIDGVAPDEAVGCTVPDGCLVFLEVAAVSAAFPDAAQAAFASFGIHFVRITIAI